MVFGAGIEISFAARYCRSYALVFQPKIPPRLVVIGRSDFTRENFPAPLIDHKAEWQKRDFVESLFEQQRNIAVSRRHLVQQSNRPQIFWRDSQRNGVSDCLVEAVVGPVLEQ